LDVEIFLIIYEYSGGKKQRFFLLKIDVIRNLNETKNKMGLALVCHIFFVLNIDFKVPAPKNKMFSALYSHSKVKSGGRSVNLIVHLPGLDNY
jgi:hypothetical protein